MHACVQQKNHCCFTPLTLGQWCRHHSGRHRFAHLQQRNSQAVIATHSRCMMLPFSDNLQCAQAHENNLLTHVLEHQVKPSGQFVSLTHSLSMHVSPAPGMWCTNNGKHTYFDQPKVLSTSCYSPRCWRPGPSRRRTTAFVAFAAVVVVVVEIHTVFYVLAVVWLVCAMEINGQGFVTEIVTRCVLLTVIQCRWAQSVLKPWQTVAALAGLARGKWQLLILSYHPDT